MALYEKRQQGCGAELIPLGQEIVPLSLESLVALLKTKYISFKLFISFFILLLHKMYALFLKEL